MSSSAALAGRQVPQVPEQADATRPHHQVPAPPAQEEEAAQHQRSVPGVWARRPLLAQRMNCADALKDDFRTGYNEYLALYIIVCIITIT